MTSEPLVKSFEFKKLFIHSENEGEKWEIKNKYHQKRF